MRYLLFPDSMAFFKKQKRRKTNRSGCGFVMIQGLLMAALLLLNSILVRAFILANQPVEDIRINQAIQFIIPLLMIFAQLWIYDFLTAKTTEDN